MNKQARSVPTIFGHVTRYAPFHDPMESVAVLPQTAAWSKRCVAAMTTLVAPDYLVVEQCEGIDSLAGTLRLCRRKHQLEEAEPPKKQQRLDFEHSHPLEEAAATSALESALAITAVKKLSVSFYSWNCDVDQGPILAAALRFDRGLVQLTIHGENLGHQTGHALGEMLRTNRVLKHLYVDLRKAEGSGLEACFPLAAALKINKSLRELVVRGGAWRLTAQALTETLQTNINLTSLTFWGMEWLLTASAKALIERNRELAMYWWKLSLIASKTTNSSLRALIDAMTIVRFRGIIFSYYASMGYVPAAPIQLLRERAQLHDVQSH